MEIKINGACSEHHSHRLINGCGSHKLFRALSALTSVINSTDKVVGVYPERIDIKNDKYKVSVYPPSARTAKELTEILNERRTVEGTYFVVWDGYIDRFLEEFELPPYSLPAEFAGKDVLGRFAVEVPNGFLAENKES